MLGGGALHAGRAAVEIAEKLGAVILTTTAGKGAVPENHPLCLGYRLNRKYTLSAFYDSYRFDQSAAVNVSGQLCLDSFGVPNCRLLQPASNADMYGVRLHLHF